MPVSVPVNPGPYGDMLHASPQQLGGHSSVSPRPSSSSSMLDVGGGGNGYGSASQPASSPLPESPTPPPPSILVSKSGSNSLGPPSHNRSLSPQQQQHLQNSQQHIQRPNLRVVIPPGPQANNVGLAISSHDRGNFNFFLNPTSNEFICFFFNHSLDDGTII